MSRKKPKFPARMAILAFFRATPRSLPSYRSGASTHHLAVAWGFAEVLPDKVTILAETAERPEEIDVKRAQEARQRAEELLKSGKTEVDYERAEDALKRADTRLQVAEKKT